MTTIEDVLLGYALVLLCVCAGYMVYEATRSTPKSRRIARRRRAHDVRMARVRKQNWSHVRTNKEER